MYLCAFVYICVYTHVYGYPYTETHTMECYANIKKKRRNSAICNKTHELWKCCASKISQRKTNAVWSHLDGEYKKNWTQKQRVDWSLPGVRMQEKWVKAVRKYKLLVVRRVKFWKSNA